MSKPVVEGIVNRMNANGDSFSFLHAEKDWQNLEGDEELLPCVYLDRPVKSKPVITASGHFKREFIYVAMFLYKSHLDDNPEQQEAVMLKARAAERNFILIMDDEMNNTVESYTLGEDYEIFNIFDCNMSGIVLPFRMIPTNDDSVCV